MRARLALLATIAGLALPTAALACREYQFPTKVDVPADTIVLTEVAQSGFYGDQTQAYGWSAFAFVKKVVTGKPENQLVAFRGIWETSGCTRTKAPPAVGELWVVYTRMEGTHPITLEALPLDVARRIDPRVAAAGL